MWGSHTPGKLGSALLRRAGLGHPLEQPASRLAPKVFEWQPLIGDPTTGKAKLGGRHAWPEPYADEPLPSGDLEVLEPGHRTHGNEGWLARAAGEQDVRTTVGYHPMSNGRLTRQRHCPKALDGLSQVCRGRDFSVFLHGSSGDGYQRKTSYLLEHTRW